MKKLALTLCLAALTTGVFAQGTVNFLNNASMLVNVDRTSTGGAIGPTEATAGMYYYALFTAPVGTIDVKVFEFSTLYATNQAVAGRLTGGANLAVPGWAAGSTRAFLIRGWSADLGHDWSVVAPLFVGGTFSGQITANSFIGASAIAPTGVAGGPLPAPAFNLFGGALGLQTGFTLIPVPEPSSFALAGLGAAAMLIFRRRK